ncbi:MAG: hypothetical protein CL579_02150 [Alteromonadaceae bacterium]|nr:hypothetical protein [Alteromonadaceae bacterium]
MSRYRAITQGSEMSPRTPHSKAVLNSMFAVLLSVSGPALAQEELEGPGIFSGEKGEFSLSEIFSDKEETSMEQEKVSGPIVQSNDNQQNNNSSEISTANRSQSAPETDEFTLFKAYKMAKSNNTPAYREFLLWLEYQDYKSSKSD